MTTTTVTCPECNMEIKIGKTVWYMGGKSYHPECIQDNPKLLAEWRKHEGLAGL